jgi:hypothetical protein
MIPLISFRDVKDRAATSISDPHVVVDPGDSDRLYLFFAVQSLNSKSEIAVVLYCSILSFLVPRVCFLLLEPIILV